MANGIRFHGSSELNPVLDEPTSAITEKEVLVDFTRITKDNAGDFLK